MRYYLEDNTLFIRGSFRAASTGFCGGIRSVPLLFCHTAAPPETGDDPARVHELVTLKAGTGPGAFGLLTTIPMEHACVLRYDSVTVFIAAGIRREPPASTGSITIIVCTAEGLEDAALLETIMVATEAKAEALAALDLPLTGTPGDAVIAASEGEAVHRSAGRAGDIGRAVREAVLRGIPEAIQRHDAGVAADRFAFFIYSRFQGGHWVEWTPGQDCPYYPCHFKGQSCDFCYCPFYPCGDERLGQWVESTNGGRVWNCASCTMIHEPAVAAYFKKYPAASREELLQVWEKSEKKG